MNFDIISIDCLTHLPYFIKEEDRQNLKTVKNIYGKEVDPDNRFFLSSSDSASLKVSVMSKKPIGIDMEQERIINPKSHPLFINENEKGLLKTEAKNENIPLLLWMIKESFLKLLGTGLHINPKKVTISKSKIFVNDLYVRCRIKIFKYQHFYITILEV